MFSIREDLGSTMQFYTYTSTIRKYPSSTFLTGPICMHGDDQCGKTNNEFKEKLAIV